MGIKTIRSASDDSSILFDQLDDAFVVKRNEEITDFKARDLTLDRDLVFRDEKNGLVDKELFVYETAAAVSHADGFEFRGATVVDDNKVVFTPHLSDFIGIYDPTDDSYETVPYDGGVCNGQAQLSNGKIVFTPENDTNVQIFDPNDDTNDPNGTLTEGPAIGDNATVDLSDRATFNDSVVLSNDRVVFVPKGADYVGIYDPSAGTNGSFIEGPQHNLDPNDTNYFSGGVVIDNDRVVMSPRDANYVGIYDPNVGTDGTFIQGPSVIGGSVASRAFGKPTKLDDGRVIFPPAGVGDNVGIYDPNDGTDGSFTVGPEIFVPSVAFEFSVLFEDLVLFIQDGVSVTDGKLTSKIVLYDPNDGPVGSIKDEAIEFVQPFFGEDSSIYLSGVVYNEDELILPPHNGTNVGVVSLEKAQFLLRSPETGITEGVDYDNLGQFIDVNDTSLDPGNVTAAGNDGDLQINESGKLGAVGGLSFDVGTNTLNSPNLGIATGGSLSMGYLPNLTGFTATRTGSGPSHQNSFYLIYAKTSDGKTTDQASSDTLVPNPFDANNYVDLSWNAVDGADTYVVGRFIFDMNTFIVSYELVEETSNTTLQDVGQTNGTFDNSVSNNTYGDVFFAPKREVANESSFLVQKDDGEVVGSSLARIEVNNGFTFGLRDNNFSIGSRSFATGSSVSASGENSFVSGDRAKASGAASFASGEYTEASGINSFATGGGASATDDNAFAQGAGTSATEFNSAAFGNNTKSTASAALAQGFNTKATGTSSHAEGSYSFSNARSSHAGGHKIVANVFGGRAVGVFNEDYLSGATKEQVGDFSADDRIFVVGTGDGTRSELFDGTGRNDGFYVTYRNGIYAQNGMTATTGDIKLEESEAGVVLTSPNGTRYKLTALDDGTVNMKEI